MRVLRCKTADARLTVQLNRSRAVTLRIIAATPKGRTAPRAAPRDSFHHQRIADWTMRNRLKRIRISRGLLRLAFLPRRTNDANESALKLQPEPVQGYSKDENQNGANNDYRFDSSKQGLSELVNLRNEHARIPLNSCDLFKSFFPSHHPVYLTS